MSPAQAGAQTLPWQREEGWGWGWGGWRKRLEEKTGGVREMERQRRKMTHEMGDLGVSWLWPSSLR